MRMLQQVSSTVWFAMLILGGLAAFIANIGYPLAKAREAKNELARDARTFLGPEVTWNTELGESILITPDVPMHKFDVTAWETVSKSGLLLGLDPEEVTNLLHAYRLAYQANNLIAQAFDTLPQVNKNTPSWGSRQIPYYFVPELQKTVKDLLATLSKLGWGTPQKS
jgi:hypothetical protein